MSIPLPVAPLVEHCRIPGGLIIRRAGQPVQDGTFGDFVAAPETSIRFDPIAVHNLSGRDLDQLPEADRNSEAVRVYTWSRVYVADGGQAADILEYQSRDWRCTQALDYSLQGAVWISTFTLVDVQQP